MSGGPRAKREVDVDEEAELEAAAGPYRTAEEAPRHALDALPVRAVEKATGEKLAVRLAPLPVAPARNRAVGYALLGILAIVCGFLVPIGKAGAFVNVIMGVAGAVAVLYNGAKALRGGLLARVPPPIVELSEEPVVRGEPFAVRVCQRGAARIARFDARITCDETYRAGDERSRRDAMLMIPDLEDPNPARWSVGKSNWQDPASKAERAFSITLVQANNLVLKPEEAMDRTMTVTLPIDAPTSFLGQTSSIDWCVVTYVEEEALVQAVHIFPFRVVPRR